MSNQETSGIILTDEFDICLQLQNKIVFKYKSMSCLSIFQTYKYKNNNKCFPQISAVRVLSLTMSYGPPLPLQGALHWTCHGESSDSNLALLLNVFASNVHRIQSQCGFFCRSSHIQSFVGAPFIYSTDTKSAFLIIQILYAACIAGGKVFDSLS